MHKQHLFRLTTTTNGCVHSKPNEKKDTYTRRPNERRQQGTEKKFVPFSPVISNDRIIRIFAGIRFHDELPIEIFVAAHVVLM